jgi:hypothetical protein
VHHRLRPLWAEAEGLLARREVAAKKHPRLTDTGGARGVETLDHTSTQPHLTRRRLRNSDAALGYPHRSVYLVVRGVWVRGLGARW